MVVVVRVVLTREAAVLEKVGEKEELPLSMTTMRVIIARKGEGIPQVERGEYLHDMIVTVSRARKEVQGAKGLVLRHYI